MHTEDDIKVFDDIDKLRERINNIDGLAISSLENVNSKSIRRPSCSDL